MIRRFALRLGHVVLAQCRVLSIAVCVAWLSLLYPFGLADQPTGYSTVSAYVGRAQVNGRGWANRAARVIDWGAALLGDGPDHCRRSWEFWARLAPQITKPTIKD